MQEADHILIPLLDGRHALAQIAKRDTPFLHLFLTTRIATPDAPTSPIAEAEVIAAQAINYQELSDGQWPAIGYEPIPRLSPPADWNGQRAMPVDTAIFEALANAIHGAYPWDGFPDRDFFAKLLRDPDKRPETARLKSQMDMI